MECQYKKIVKVLLFGFLTLSVVTTLLLNQETIAISVIVEKKEQMLEEELYNRI